MNRSAGSNGLPPIRRRPDGSIDVEHYVIEARRMRAAQFDRLLRAIVSLFRRPYGASDQRCATMNRRRNGNKVEPSASGG